MRIGTQLVGEHWVTSVLAAIAAGSACGIRLTDCVEVLSSVEPALGRSSVHHSPNGEVYILDIIKAPYWTIAPALSFIKHARAPRKTIVFGTISDYPGANGPRYRRVAREALSIADRVIFVGPHSGHIDRLRKDDLRERLFAFQTAYQAAGLLSESTLQDEIIYVKSSLRADHLERLMLSQLDDVVCWREGCGKKVACSSCRSYRTDSPPPFGLAERLSGSKLPLVY